MAEDRSRSVGPRQGRALRILAVARVEMLRLLRDRAAMALILTVPALQLILFGFAVELDPKNVPVAVAGEIGARVERALTAAEQAGRIRLVARDLPEGEARRAVEAGAALIGIELPPPFEPRGPQDRPVPTRVYLDATDPGAVRPALAALQTALWDATPSAPRIEQRWLFNPETVTAWTLVPGLVGAVAMISMLMLGALTLVRERDGGTWEALLATPLTGAEALIGKLAPYLPIALVQGSVVLAVGMLAFDLPARGALWALLLALPVYALAHLALGFAVSALARTPLQAIQGAVLFYLPAMLLSGFLYPRQGMPTWAKALGEVFPLTHFVRAARGVLLRGDGAGTVLAEMTPVAVFALAASILAVAAYRTRLE